MGNSSDSASDKKWPYRKLVSRRSLLKTALAAGGTILAAACAPSSQPASKPAGGASSSPTSAPSNPAGAAATSVTPAAGTIKRGGTIIGAQQNNWEHFDPHRNTLPAYAYREIYNSLVRLQVQPDGTLKATPDLALSWELKNDTATFKLREGVKFHDGSDWNAQVAKYNIERMKDAKSAAKSYVASVKSAEVVDPYTLKLTLNAPSGPLLSNLSQAADALPYMISMEMAQKAGDKYGTSPETTAGTGPMKLIEWAPSNYHTVQRTGSYWTKGADGNPITYYDSLKIRFIADDSVRVTELRSGNVHLIDNVAAKDIPAAQQDSSIDLVQNPYQFSCYLFCFSAKSEKFKNVKLRQAVQYAIDREALAKVLGQGVGEAMYYFLTPGYVGYDAKLPHYSVDLAKAKQLVADAGYPSGVTVSLAVSNREIDTKQSQMLKQMLAAAGITVNIDLLDRTAWGDKMHSLQYEMATYWTNVRPDPDSIMAPRFQTGQDKNYSGMSDKAMDELLDKGRGSYDDAVRADAYGQVQKSIYESAWYGPLWYGKYYTGYSKKLQGRLVTQEPQWDLREAWLAS